MLSGDFAKPGSETDIMTITETFQYKGADITPAEQEANLLLEIKIEQMCQRIRTDMSPRANRTIGRIEGKRITAKQIEEQALRYRVSGHEAPYHDAWELFMSQIHSQWLAWKYDINVEEEVKAANDRIREEYASDPLGNPYLNNVFLAKGMTDEELWQRNYELMKNVYRISKVKDYLEEHNLPEFDLSQITAKVTDAEYREKIARTTL